MYICASIWQVQQTSPQWGDCKREFATASVRRARSHRLIGLKTSRVFAVIGTWCLRFTVCSTGRDDTEWRLSMAYTGALSRAVYAAACFEVICFFLVISQYRVLWIKTLTLVRPYCAMISLLSTESYSTDSCHFCPFREQIAANGGVGNESLMIASALGAMIANQKVLSQRSVCAGRQIAPSESILASLLVTAVCKHSLIAHYQL